MEELAFSFDFISPYAYLAWTQIHGLAERHGLDVAPRPVLFAGLLNHHGQKGPAEIPAKRAYIFKDCLRRARVLGVPFAAPPSHPFKPLLALRAVHACPHEKRRALIDGLFAATWGGASAIGIDDPRTVARIASERGIDGDALVASADRAKDALRSETDAAISRGIFGVPAMEARGELFWGLDSLDLLERFLRGEPQPDAGEIAAFLDRPATAQRV
jgi:2-hydroxychromene-2-carboxylate isomerase